MASPFPSIRFPSQLFGSGGAWGGGMSLLAHIRICATRGLYFLRREDTQYFPTLQIFLIIYLYNVCFFPFLLVFSIPMHRFVSLCRLEKSATDRGAASDASKTPPKVGEEPLQTCRDANVYAFASLHVCNSPTWYQVGLSQM